MAAITSLVRPLRILSLHLRPPIPPPLLRRPFSHCTASPSLTGKRRPRYPDTLPEHQLLYQQGYPLDSLDDFTPKMSNRKKRSNIEIEIDEDVELPQALNEIPIGGQLSTASMTSSGTAYILKRYSETSYSCNCMAWKMAKGKAPDARSCKHLRAALGDEHENARCNESKTTQVYTPQTNPINVKKRARKLQREEDDLLVDPTKSKLPIPDPPKRMPSAHHSSTPIRHPRGGGGGGGSSLLDSSNLQSSSTMSSSAAIPKSSRKLSTTSLIGGGTSRTTLAKEKKKKSQEEEEEGFVDDVEDVDGGGKNGGKGKAKEGEGGGRELLLAHKFDLESGKVDPKGWWMSEKLDGIRAYWDGQTTLWSRTRKPLQAPSSFLAHLPRGRTLDGELYLGRDRFDETSGIVRSLSSPRWDELKYMIFDIPSLASQPFEQRLQELELLFPTVSPQSVQPQRTTTADGEDIVVEEVEKAVVVVVKHEVCQGLEGLKEKLKEVQELGGEGLMLRQPGSIYVGKRSKTLLKVKTFYDAEAKVVGYEAGKGKYVGMTGSLICEMEDGETRFNVGSGMNDERRLNPPPIGSIITYRFFELTKQSIPRFPTFVGERIDMDRAKDAVVRNDRSVTTDAAGGVGEVGEGEEPSTTTTTTKKKSTTTKKKSKKTGKVIELDDE